MSCLFFYSYSFLATSTYSSHRMSLVVLGPAPLKELAGHVTSFFSSIPRHSTPDPSSSFMRPPFPLTHVGRRIRMVPLGTTSTITFHFQIERGVITQYKKNRLVRGEKHR